ncbi:MAG: hypothetical protein JSW10_12850 [Pseudomonadota bacterium]|nr:MAG: hypothetical protein JSW10_12850 [Pseudomonadota bacterium]
MRCGFTMYVGVAAAVVVLLMVLLAGCDRQPAADAASVADHTAMLMFMEQERGVEPYPTRMVANARYVRIDDGEGASDYVLFDRQARLIYSVNTGSRAVMVVEPQDVPVEPPMELKFEHRKVAVLQDAPTVNDVTPVHYQFVANGEVCFEFIAVKGLMEDVAAGLREYHAVLASDSAVTFNPIPADMHNACDMAQHTFAPGRNLTHGFPIQEWHSDGYSRTLMEYDEDYLVEPGLFEIPADFRRYTVQELRSGGVPG